MRSFPEPLLSVKPQPTSDGPPDIPSPLSRPAPVSVVTARRGVRRSPAQLQRLLQPTVDRDQAMELLNDPEIWARAIAGCRVITSVDGKKVQFNSLRWFSTISVRQLVGVRRLGSHHGARSTLATHATRLDGRPRLVFAESLLESAWMSVLDRRDDVHGYLGQGCVMTWPISDLGYLHHFIDILTDTDDGMTLMSVKPDHLVTGFNGLVLEELLPDSCRAHGVGYELLGTLSDQCRVNLRALAAWRWKQPVDREEWWRPATPGTTISLARLARQFGGAELGRGRALLALAQNHLDIDLDQPIRTSTIGVWR